MSGTLIFVGRNRIADDVMAREHLRVQRASNGLRRFAKLKKTRILLGKEFGDSNFAVLFGYGGTHSYASNARSAIRWLSATSTGIGAIVDFLPL